MFADQAMADAAEKRREERVLCHAAVIWTYFNKPETHPASLRNFSPAGACVECPQAPLLGSTIMVRMEGYPAGCREGCKNEGDCPWPRSLTLGEVKWCRELSGGGARIFGFGLQFHL
jgi:hypothetical protein